MDETIKSCSETRKPRHITRCRYNFSPSTRNMMIFLLMLALVTIAVQGTPFEIPHQGVTLDLSTVGVDIQFCKTFVYQVKACEDHGFEMMNDVDYSIATFKISSWANGKTRLHRNLPVFKYYDAGYPQLLHCDQFRWLWMKWDDGRIKFGRGPEPEVNTMIDADCSGADQITKLGFSTINNNFNVTMRIGEAGKDRFALVLEEGKFSDGMIRDSSISLKSCASLCSEHANCGMFSYNQGLGICAIFDRMNSSFAMTSTTGWRSWKMMYCYP